MRTRRFYRVLGLGVLGLMMMLAAWSVPAGAEGPRWLAFDRAAAPAGEPSLSLLHADATAIDLQAGLPGCQVEEIEVDGQVYSHLYGSGYGLPATTGLPNLPILRRDVEIPFGAAVSLEIVSIQAADYALAELGLRPIYPLQPPVPKLPGERGNQPFVIDREFYAVGSLYPAAPVTLGEQYTVRGHRIQTVEIWPVAYDPTADTVRLVRSVTFHLRLVGSDLGQTQALAQRYATPAYETRLAATVLNYNQGRPAVTFGPDTSIGYLIIVADNYYDALQPFVQLKASRGFDVTTTRTSEIPGGATTTAIKAYIQTAYDTWPLPPSYVLLVGDTDTVPTWTGTVIGTSTDLYYGTMDGASDWHPDIGRGRFPVRSPAQTTIMVDKYLAYATMTGQEPWLKQASFPATCDNYTVAEGTHNYVISTHTAPGGWTGNFPTATYPGGDKLYCITYSATHADLMEMFNEGRWAIIYSGHGSYGGWEMSFTQSDINNLTSYGLFPFVASHACVSGNFGQTEVFGETWVLAENKGGLIFWGSSTNSFWDEDDVLERRMFDSLFSEPYGHARISEMTDYGLAAVETSYPSSGRYYWETYNVLGDPAAKLFLVPDLPSFSLDVSPSEFELCESGQVTSTIVIGSVGGYSETVYLETGPLPNGMTAGFDVPSAQAPFTAVLTVDVAVGTAAGSYPVVITATDQVSWTQDTEILVRVRQAEPAAPVLLSPADGAADQPFMPTFDWEEMPDAAAYRFQLDGDPLFELPLFDEGGLAQPHYTADSALDGGRCYWWRAAADNACGAGEWALPFHFSTVLLTPAFADDVESGNIGWTAQSPWAITVEDAHSGTHSWTDSPGGAYQNYLDTALTSPVIDLSDATQVILSFWHDYSTEADYDYCRVEYSIDGGSSWTQRMLYDGVSGGWVQEELVMPALEGQANVRLRFRLTSDVSIALDGWHLDDIMLLVPMAPNPLPTALSITPDSGSAYQETPVTIEGTDFLATPSLRLGDTWLMSVTLVSSTTLQAVVPASMATGLYTLTLYNGDCQEATLADAFTIVGECLAPTATFESDSPVTLGEPMHFFAAVTSTLPVTFDWQFGGEGQGSGLATATPVYTYTAAGSFTVTLTVQNTCGATATAGGQVEVLLPPTFFVYLPVVVK